VEPVAGYIADEYPTGAHIVEVGVGRHDTVARQLASEGYDVTATDIRDISEAVSERVEFVRDDVRSPDAAVYEGASLVYSLRAPYELHSDLVEVTRRFGADLIVSTVAGERPNFDARLINRKGEAFFLRRF
jgi:uncharacterized UPF0146 family protein